MRKQAAMRDFSRLPQMESLLAGSKRIKCTQNKKNQYGHNFIYFHKNTLIIFLFYIFTTLHQKFMYNCQVSWKICTRPFFSLSPRWMIGTVKAKRRKETATLDTAKTGNRKVTFKLNNHSCWENGKRKSMQRMFELHLTCISVALHYD